MPFKDSCIWLLQCRDCWLLGSVPKSSKMLAPYSIRKLWCFAVSPQKERLNTKPGLINKVEGCRAEGGSPLFIPMANALKSPEWITLTPHSTPHTSSSGVLKMSCYKYDTVLMCVVDFIWRQVQTSDFPFSAMCIKVTVYWYYPTKFLWRGEIIISISISQRRTLKHTEVGQCAQGHIASKRQSWDYNRGPSESKSLCAWSSTALYVKEYNVDLFFLFLRSLVTLNQALWIKVTHSKDFLLRWPFWSHGGHESPWPKSASLCGPQAGYIPGGPPRGMCLETWGSEPSCLRTTGGQVRPTVPAAPVTSLSKPSLPHL